MGRFFVICLALSLLLVVAPSGAIASNDDCLSCHDDPELANSRGLSLNVDPEVFQGSIHGENEFDCVDCHDALADAEDFPHAAPLDPVDCSMCHDSEFEDYTMSVHGKAFNAGDQSVPVCATCHGTHNIRRQSDPESLVYPINLVDVCIECHTDTKIVAEHDMASPEKIKAFESSVHMVALKKKGLTVSAACNDCHGSHKVKPADDPKSPANRLNIPKTCAQCHQGIYKTYLESVHGQDYLAGNQDVPVCTDCHGEHSIKAPANPESTVYSTHIAEICSNCHEDETLTKRYGFAVARLKSYLGTYHGIASKMGDTKTANCASCHGFHDIRPATDPESSIHPDNIPKTCGNCHPQAGKNFAVGKIHLSELRESSKGALLVENFYKIAISGSVGGFIVFIIVDLIARRRRAKKAKTD
jgi:hypothetical protein